MKTQKLSYKYSFRLDDKDNIAFRKNMLLSRMKMSCYIRQTLFKNKITPRFSKEELITLRDLRGISTNLNQLAHKANQNQEFILLALDIKQTKKKIDLLISKFRL